MSPRPRRTRAVVAVALAIAACLAATPVLASTPTGERQHGQVSVEPAYDDATGNIVYLATPINAPFPSHTNAHSVAPLYLVVYPPGTAGTFNCMRANPGNCPDHAFNIAFAATQIMGPVYGADPYAIPGHDHLVSVPAGHGDFNVAWHVYLELFTPDAPVSHITTEDQLDAAKASGHVIQVDSGIEFLCAVVSQASYLVGTPIGN